jgi:hypothetical protein
VLEAAELPLLPGARELKRLLEGPERRASEDAQLAQRRSGVPVRAAKAAVAQLPERLAPGPVDAGQRELPDEQELGLGLGG